MRPKCLRLLKNNKFVNFISDDEPYFTLSNSTLAGNDRYYSDDVANTPDEIEYKLTPKFEKKILILTAFSPKSVSKSYFVLVPVYLSLKLFYKTI